VGVCGGGSGGGCVCVCVYICGAGDRTQDLKHVRQAPCQGATYPGPGG
jgi:hypothetical protein